MEIGEEDDKESISGRTVDFPEIPGSAKGKGSVTFDLDESQMSRFSLDTAFIILGSSNEVQARIPLEGDTDLVSLVPVEQTPGLETVEAGAFTLKPTKTELRWDTPNENNAAGKDQTYLVVTFDATSSADATSTLWFYSENFSVEQPDGTSVTADRIINPKDLSASLDPGSTTKGFIAIFVLDTPVDGEYKFAISGDLGPDGSAVKGEPVAFELSANAKSTNSDSGTDDKKEEKKEKKED